MRRASVSGRSPQAAAGLKPKWRPRSIEGALAADELEAAIIRKRLVQADAGGPFVRHEDVLAWLKALSEGQQEPPPKATVTS